ncbi:LuxR C-terminal-related transcriptional regulator [Streptomyces sp. NPDC001068]|uniref:helix-turn-helix transcriptional regulator n=1 Tax=Streptomyces sp. NPDC001068 TaxID=3364544 RepID=UPI00368FD70E
MNADDPTAAGHQAADGRSGTAETGTPLAVAVVSVDQITYEGGVAALAGFPGLRVLPRGDEREADVLVAFDDAASDQVLKHVERISADRPHTRAVLVTGSITEPRLVRAISLGVVSVVLRPTATFSEIADAAVAASIGHADVPPHILGPLIQHMRRMERHGPGPGPGLSTRDMTVLRLLSDGLDTAQIAGRLSYSERTIKSIVHAIINTLGVNNRTHAVAYMIRAGLL